MKLEQLAEALLERDLTLYVHTPPNAGQVWIVWLCAADDPALGAFVGNGDSLEDAIRDALRDWDEGQKQETSIAPAAEPKCIRCSHPATDHPELDDAPLARCRVRGCLCPCFAVSLPGGAS